MAPIGTLRPRSDEPGQVLVDAVTGEIDFLASDYPASKETHRLPFGG
jgi:hypothetical protein